MWEQSLGDVAITTIGSAVKTSSHSRWVYDSTVYRLRNRSISCTDDSTNGVRDADEDGSICRGIAIVFESIEIASLSYDSEFAVFISLKESSSFTSSDSHSSQLLSLIESLLQCASFIAFILLVSSISFDCL